MTYTEWQKSSFSGSGNDCVEVCTTNGAVELRESDEGHLILRTTPTTFATFLQAAKAGEFHHVIATS
ncbi:DUF397 domain-containing protein [Streptomyces kaniharaensis]|uniref:DUF397 domain-containing protein n=1 Tax=Streptomyces kaniharaensis TaxID=212423 RepID=A0A6N7KQE0_9ACTN|nr:DUF397 domain-containing protein [Streptomyces kaniharaensis]MQS11823.1 DUF397 domain-containing protein [Streptomyces kaniharaensis]